MWLEIYALAITDIAKLMNPNKNMLEKVYHKTELNFREQEALESLKRAQHRKGMRSFDEKKRHAHP